MCMFSAPKAPGYSVAQRDAARAPDNGNAEVRQGDLRKRRLAMASSVFTSPSLGSPATTNPLGA